MNTFLCVRRSSFNTICRILDGMEDHFNFFAYDDFIELLKDYIHFRKAKGLTFSYRWFSQKAGYTSPNFLHLIVTRRRKLNPTSVRKIVEVFKWSGTSRKYFEQLVIFNQANDINERQQAAEKLAHLRFTSKLYGKVDPHRTELLYQNPMNIFIRELALRGLPKNTKFIQERLAFRCSENDIAQSIESLLKNKFIRIENNMLFATDKHFTTGDEISSELVKRFHSECMKIAVSSMYTIPREERDISAVTFHTSKENIEIIKNKIRHLRKEILSLENNRSSTNGEQVYHLGIQFVPITKEPF